MNISNKKLYYSNLQTIQTIGYDYETLELVDISGKDLEYAITLKEPSDVNFIVDKINYGYSLIVVVNKQYGSAYCADILYCAVKAIEESSGKLTFLLCGDNENIEAYLYKEKEFESLGDDEELSNFYKNLSKSSEPDEEEDDCCGCDDDYELSKFFEYLKQPSELEPVEEKTLGEELDRRLFKFIYNLNNLNGERTYTVIYCYQNDINYVKNYFGICRENIRRFVYEKDGGDHYITITTDLNNYEEGAGDLLFLTDQVDIDNFMEYHQLNINRT